MTTRRDLLRAGTSLGLGAAFAGVPGLGRLAFAADAAADRGLLVVLHLRGGCDGLNFVSPANDRSFVEARAGELRAADSGDGAGWRLANGADPKVDFRLHNAAKGLSELYDGGHLAVIHAAGLTDATRSHFVATDMIEHGVANNASLSRVPTGWLGRYSAGLVGRVPVVAASAALPGSLAGATKALAVPDAEHGVGLAGGAEAERVMQRLYAQPAMATSAATSGVAGVTLASVGVIGERLPKDGQGKVAAYTPMAGIDYAPAQDLARPLKVVAELAKMDLGLQVATVDFGGWDTHEGQAGRFKTLTERLSAGLSAFYNDMAPYHDRLTVVTLTEFGRRLRSNKSGGTDHGRATVMTVLGGKVNGGRMYGVWPGLEEAQLDEGVDLAVKTDYRQVLSEVLIARDGRVAADIFPGYTAPGRLGIVRA